MAGMAIRKENWAAAADSRVETGEGGAAGPADSGEWGDALKQSDDEGVPPAGGAFTELGQRSGAGLDFAAQEHNHRRDTQTEAGHQREVDRVFEALQGVLERLADDDDRDRRHDDSGDELRILEEVEDPSTQDEEDRQQRPDVEGDDDRMALS